MTSPSIENSAPMQEDVWCSCSTAKMQGEKESIFSQASAFCHIGYGEPPETHPARAQVDRISDTCSQPLVVLKAHSGEPFKPIDWIPPKLLSMKTVLLALPSAKRLSDLCSALVHRLNCSVLDRGGPKGIQSSFRSRTDQGVFLYFTSLERSLSVSLKEFTPPLSMWGLSQAFMLLVCHGPCCCKNSVRMSHTWRSGTQCEKPQLWRQLELWQLHRLAFMLMVMGLPPGPFPPWSHLWAWVKYCCVGPLLMGPWVQEKLVQRTFRHCSGFSMFSFSPSAPYLECRGGDETSL